MAPSDEYVGNLKKILLHDASVDIANATRKMVRYVKTIGENDVIHKVKIGSCCSSTFTARRYAGVVYAIVVCLCLSVCPSVCHKRAGIISARLDRVTLQQFVTYATLLHGLLLLLLLP